MYANLPQNTASTIDFFNTLKSVSSDVQPIPTQMPHIYDMENRLRHKFIAQQPVSDPYEGLISVFHPDVVSVEANKTKPRTSDTNVFENHYLLPLTNTTRRKEGEDSFVQNGLFGFETNFHTFTDFALVKLNWY